MLRRLLIASAALLLADVAFAQAYKWVDEDGVVQYSDRPHAGAEIIELPSYDRPSSSTSTRRSAVRRSPASQQADDEENARPFSYQTLEIESPAAEETLWNIEGVLNVRLNLRPTLQPGHQLRVYFDGEAQTVNGTSFQLQEVWRGMHNIQAEVQDRSGKVMIRSLPNRFYVQQTSIARPN